MKRPCLRCGEPAEASYCSEHRPAEQRKTKRSATALGYDTAWRKLSERARRLQPWCTDCGTSDNLTADHLPIAWQRKAEGKTIRLDDIEVVCLTCNIARGSTRGGVPGPGPFRFHRRSRKERYT